MVTNTRKIWLRDLLMPFDYLRYMLWRLLSRLSHSNNEITVRLRESGKIVLRPFPRDYLAIAYEIFLDEAYRQPIDVPKINPKLIVDIGANLGYSVVYFAYKYPNSRLVAFEPHPAHLSVINRHLEVNSFSNRVDVIENAVSNRNADMFITDKGDTSTVMESAEADCFPIKVLDFFAWVGNQTIDLLKMDIEGGEYAILNDQRFATTNINTIVLEWHNTELIPNGHQWCSERLTELGYKVINGKLEYENAGILWAYK